MVKAEHESKKKWHSGAYRIKRLQQFEANRVEPRANIPSLCLILGIGTGFFDFLAVFKIMLLFSFQLKETVT
jgi:hypothetical protein